MNAKRARQRPSRSHDNAISVSHAREVCDIDTNGRCASNAAFDKKVAVAAFFTTFFLNVFGDIPSERGLMWICCEFDVRTRALALVELREHEAERRT